MARFNDTDYAAAGNLVTGHFTLALITGFNPGVNTVYVQLFDKVTPANPDVPVQSILVGPGSNFSYRPSEQAAPYNVAFSYAVSSTPNVLTAAADVIWVRLEGQTGQ